MRKMVLPCQQRVLKDPRTLVEVENVFIQFIVTRFVDVSFDLKTCRLQEYSINTKWREFNFSTITEPTSFPLAQTMQNNECFHFGHRQLYFTFQVMLRTFCLCFHVTQLHDHQKNFSKSFWAINETTLECSKKFLFTNFMSTQKLDEKLVLSTFHTQ